MFKFVRRGAEYGVVHWQSTARGRPLELFQQIPMLDSLTLSAEKIRTLFDLGAIYLENNRLLDWQQLEIEQPVGTYFRLHTNPRRFDLSKIDLRQRIVHENQHWLILDKPSAIPCHPTVDNKNENLLSALQNLTRAPLFLTHRLDVPTQGLLLFAKTLEFQTEFNRMLSEKRIRKFYRARVEGPLLQAQTLIHHMESSPRAPKKVSRAEQPGWAYCELQILGQQGAWVNIELKTGRTHQIRAQLSDMGWPIWGDRMYGSKIDLGLDRIALQACRLQFEYGNQEFEFNLPEPGDLGSPLESI